MYLHLNYWSGDRSIVEAAEKKTSAGITADRLFFLDAMDLDGDSLRFQHNNGSHLDVIFLCPESARAVYDEILAAVREGLNLTEMDIREMQLARQQESLSR